MRLPALSLDTEYNKDMIYKDILFLNDFQSDKRMKTCTSNDKKADKGRNNKKQAIPHM